jgi:divalent metal cation (Fe/Co/Zn/Cd) transporter
VDGTMNVFDSHELGKKVELTIKNIIPNVYDIMLHIEPKGNIEKGEKC